jgi:hypothetical protein
VETAGRPAYERKNETHTETLSVRASESPLSPVLAQPLFQLSEADFLRLRHSSPVLGGAGGACVTFALAYALPKLVQLLVTAPGHAPWSSTDTIVVSVCGGLGLGLLVARYFLSKDRRGVMKKVRVFFEQNPGKHEIRAGD